MANEDNTGEPREVMEPVTEAVVVVSVVAVLVAVAVVDSAAAVLQVDGDKRNGDHETKKKR